MRASRSFASIAALLLFGTSATPGTRAAAATPAPAADTRGVTLPSSREVRLPNGALLVLAEKHDVPLIAFLAFVRGGSLTDPPGKEGVGALMGELLRKGAGSRSAGEIAAAADGVGGVLSTG
ncbi:MAG TPA: insulinase family protein, partial [Candidatus Eisenbacteria bacterium]|nr:insulinase family protein [Candidatus Eisenbacteria bacterium]